jgi:hypothetical protein
VNTVLDRPPHAQVPANILCRAHGGYEGAEAIRQAGTGAKL